MDSMSLIFYSLIVKLYYIQVVKSLKILQKIN